MNNQTTQVIELESDELCDFEALGFCNSPKIETAAPVKAAPVQSSSAK